MMYPYRAQKSALARTGSHRVAAMRTSVAPRCASRQRVDHLSLLTEGLSVTTSRVRQRLSEDADLLLDSLRDIVGAPHVLTDPDSVSGYVTDWTGRWEGTALAVVRPGDTEEVAAVLAACHRAN